MATIVVRKTLKGTIFQAKVRLKGFPTRCASFPRKTDAARWASATETHVREAKHFPKTPTQHTLSELIQRYQREILKFFLSSQRTPTTSAASLTGGRLSWAISCSRRSSLLTSRSAAIVHLQRPRGVGSRDLRQR